MNSIWSGIKRGGEILPLGCMALFFIAALYPIWNFLFFWETWLVILILFALFGALAMGARSYNIYIKDLKDRGVITERDEYWVNMIGLLIIFFALMMRR